MEPASIILWGIVGVYAVFMVCMRWWWLCIKRTSEQRKHLIELTAAASRRRLDTTADFRRMFCLFDQFESVTFEQHERALFWRRDPWLLYPEELRNEISAVMGPKH